MRRYKTTTCTVLGLFGPVLASGCGSEPLQPSTISVTITPATVSLLTGGSQDFSASVSDDVAGKGVTWRITGCTGGAATCGSLNNATSTTATYTAPASVPPGTLGVTATAAADSSKSSTAAITVVARSGPPALMTQLQYPTGLWIKNGIAYVTETAGRNTSFGGNVRLLRFDLATQQGQVLLDHPINSDAVAVADDGTIYLTSYVASIPGEKGSLSKVRFDSAQQQWVETPLLSLAIASDDMFLDVSGDLYIIGSSDSDTAESLYRLPFPDYTSAPSVIARGLGRATSVTKVGSDIYYSTFTDSTNGRSVVVARGVRLLNGGTHTPFLTGVSITSTTSDGTSLYMAAFSTGQILRKNLATGVVDTIAAGLNMPLTVRYDPQSASLYFLEAGTEFGGYRDGSLKVITNLHQKSTARLLTAP